eukprot:scaffold82549_cov35-Tisochrysis_lutea.AAC.3
MMRHSDGKWSPRQESDEPRVDDITWPQELCNEQGTSRTLIATVRVRVCRCRSLPPWRWTGHSASRWPAVRRATVIPGGAAPVGETLTSRFFFFVSSVYVRSAGFLYKGLFSSEKKGNGSST